MTPIRTASSPPDTDRRHRFVKPHLLDRRRGDPFVAPSCGRAPCGVAVSARELPSVAPRANRLARYLSRNVPVALTILFAACGSDDASTPAAADAGADILSVATDTGTAYENCFNGTDDNGDRLVDCADPQCRTLDACRTYQCPDGDLGNVIGYAAFRASTRDANNDLAGSCGGEGGDDLALTWTAPESGEYFIDTRWDSYDTVLYVLEGGCDGAELVCNDDAAEPRSLGSEVRLDAVAGRTYLIVVDGYEVVLGDSGDAFALSITPVVTDDESAFCVDRRDNDGDGLVDCSDDDCDGVDGCLPLGGVAALDGGQHHTCASGDGSWCWGAGGRGELGNGETTSSPWPVATDRRFRRIEAGIRFACGLDESGVVACWGDGSYDRFFLGEWADSPIPVDIPLSGPARDVAVGPNHACAILETERVECWGANDYGQHGNGDTSAPDGAPNRMIDIGQAVDIACGAGHTCVVRSSGEVWCAGLNNSGQIGSGAEWNYTRPQPMNGIENALEVSTGHNHTCVRLEDGGLRCVGQNWQGQLGDGTQEEARRARSVLLETRAEHLYCGSHHCCAIDEHLDLWCWGANGWGQLGLGHTDRVLRPERVGLGFDAAAGGAGDEHTCVASTDGEVWCWGNNRSGQLGDGTVEVRMSPTRVLAPR